VSFRRKRPAGGDEALVERRRRQDAAPRLRDEIVGLLSLRLTFEDLKADGRTSLLRYTRPIAVASAPAHFEFRCMHAECDGEHDLTGAILPALRESRRTFAGESNCGGLVAGLPCDRTITYTFKATYAGLDP
jgi:hypothetical protein